MNWTKKWKVFRILEKNVVKGCVNLIPRIASLEASGVTGSEPGQMHFQKFWAQPLMSIEAFPSEGEISPFWFMCPYLPTKVYNLTVFEKFLDVSLQNFSLEIFCNTPIGFVILRLLFQENSFKRCFLSDI